MSEISSTPQPDDGPPRQGNVCDNLLHALFGVQEGAVRMVVRVKGMLTPTIIDDRPHLRLVLAPLTGGGEFRTQPLRDYAIIKTAQEALRTGTYVEILGSFGEAEGHPRKAKKSEVVFHLVDLYEATEQCQRASATPEEIARADRLIDEFLRLGGGALKEYVLDTCYKVMDKVRTSQSRRFKQAENAVLLQAVSGGQVAPDVNGRISLCAVSRPGVGKKTMGNMSLALATVGQLVQPAMMSVAGLSARVEQRDGAWKAEPGALPNCSWGTIVIEDLHRVPKNILNAAQGGLMTTAEDGRIIPTKSAMATYSAYTALHISTNLYSGINATHPPDTISAKLKDLGLPFDLLSRLDIILHLDAGDNATRQARDILMQKIARQTPKIKEDKAEKERMLKVLIARLIDRFHEVDFETARTEMLGLMDDVSLVIGEISAQMDDEQQQAFDCEGLLRRMANSIRKLVTASARLEGRTHATPADVETAWDMIAFKLEIVRWICDEQALRLRTIRSREQMVADAQESAGRRWTELLTNYGGQTVALCDVAREMELALRTVGRDLEGHGFYPEAGWCRIPTLAEAAEQAARQAQGEGSPEPPLCYSEEDYQLRDPNEGLEDEDSEETEEARDTGPAVKLEPPGPELQPVIAAMNAPEVTEKKELMGKYLWETAFNYQVSEPGTAYKMDMVKMMIQSAMPRTIENGRLLTAVITQLKSEEDETVRGRLALKLMVNAGIWQDWFSRTEWEKALLRKDLPAGLRDPVESILARIHWVDQKWHEQRKREAEERKRQQEREVF